MRDLLHAWMRLVMTLAFDVWRYPDAVRDQINRKRRPLPAADEPEPPSPADASEKTDRPL